RTQVDVQRIVVLVAHEALRRGNEHPQGRDDDRRIDRRHRGPWRSTPRRLHSYARSRRLRARSITSPKPRLACSAAAFRNRLHSIGVSVTETMPEMRIAVVIITANSRNPSNLAKPLIGASYIWGPMNISAVFIRRPIATSLLMVGIAGMGGLEEMRFARFG